MRLKKSFKKVISSMLAIGMVSSMMGDVSAATKNTKSPQITVDYNTNIGTGSKYIFGGSGVPSPDEASAWSSMNSKMGVKLVKIPVDLSKLYPNVNGQVDTNVKEEYLHVASGQFTRARGAGMDIMIEFVNLPAWLDTNNDKKYDDEVKYTSMIKEFLNDAIEYKDIIKFVEIAPDESLNSSDFVEVYYTTAKAIRSLGSNYTIGGPGYTLTDVNDRTLGKIQDLLTRYNDESDKSLLQFISLRAYNVDVNNYESDYFGEFKEGRKKIRNWSNNADMPLFMTGWTTVSKNANTPDNNVTGNIGIKQQANALFKAMRDGWDMVLFNSTTSSKNSPSSYSYTVDGDKVTLNPFTKSWDLLSNKLSLGSGEFKVVSTDMGSNWIVDDSIAMINSKNESIILASNFGNEKTDVNIELKNVPYEDGKVELECYVAKEGVSTDTAYAKVSANVVNGMINTTIPSIPSGGATGIIVKGGTKKDLPAQTMYEFESQDNHLGGETEITWQTGASFNRVVKNFGGANNFVKLNKIAADGAGTYTAKLYAGSANSAIKVSVNGEDPITIDGSNASISNSVDFDITLKAGNENNIKVYTESGELRPDRLVLVAKDVKLSVGFQNLNTLSSIGEGNDKKYVLPLARKDFKVDGRIFPDNVSNSYNLEYSSSNENIVTVNNQGVLTPLAVGESEITANIVGKPEVKNTFKIVVENAVSGISVTPKTITLKQNQTAKISAKVLPENAENKNITWNISNPNLVEIENSNNDEATVKVIGESGNAIITARTEDGGYEATCSITVIKPELAGEINIDYSNTIANGSPGIFGVTHYPSLNKKDNDIGDHSKVWEMLRDDMGVKFMRADARLQEILPIWTKTPNTNWASNSDTQPGQPSYVEADYYYVTGPDGVDRKFSVEGYRADMDHFAETGEYLNGMSDPKNWNTERLMNWVKKADEMDFEVMVMTFQIPEWLASGYPLPGAPHTEKACNSAPKDWEIFRDIIQKVYKMVEPYADYYEFLNEPHWYVPKGGDQKRPDGTPYPDSNKVNLIASDTMYQAIDAIYELEGKKPAMKLGGGADDSWGGNYGVLGTLFSDEYSKEWQDRVEFVSIHKYGERPANQSTSNDGANSRNFKYWLRQRTGKDLPIFLNEYNASTGQPHEYHTGEKSMSYHGRIMIDMMLDGYEGGGYYTCYPSDVPMDDYEASSGWIERGKGVYAWNNGNPTLATFTKTWNLLSKKLELGDGDFKVKSTDVSDSKISDGIGAINANGKPVAFLTNYSSNEYGNIVINMNNVPYQKGEKVTAKVYSMTTNSTIDIEPVVMEATVNEDGAVVVEVDSIGSNGVVGVILEGNIIEMADKTIEFESYLNKFNGLAKIENNNSASNKRLVTNISGGKANSVDISIDTKVSSEYTTSLQYNSSQEVELSYTINDEEVKKVILPASSGFGNVEIKLPLLAGVNTIRFYNESGTNVILDKIDIQGYEESVDKTNLQALVNSIEEKLAELNQDDYINNTWINIVKALEKAKEVLNDTNVSQDVVNDTYEELTKYYSDLSIKPNKEELKELVIESEKFKENKYTEISWNKFDDILTKAKNILEDEDATENEVSEIVTELKSAIENLEKSNSSNNGNKGVKKDLKKLIEKADKLKEDKYTAQSWEVFKGELEKAREALDNDDITKDEVLKIIESLENAMDNLDKTNKK